MTRRTNRTSSRVAALGFAIVLASGCTPGASGSPPAFVGRLWITTDAAASPGTLRVFLPDGTLLMDSCGETYRLVRWSSVAADRITWEEDTATIDADVVRATEQDLHLRLHLGREVKDEQYRRADAPYVCPETRAGP